MSASILIVDDRPANLVALEAVLEPLGQRVVRAESGLRALELAAKLDDLAVILLDVQMPTLDGFETTRRLREKEHTRAVPVILVTAVHDGLDFKARGYSLGVVDYLTKPIQADFLLAKVGAFVAWYEQRRELERKQAALEAAQLASDAKDQFLAMVSHELRTPLAAILGWSDLLAGGLPPEKAERAVRAIQRSAHAQSQLVEDLLDVSRMIAGKLELVPGDVDLAAVVRDAIETIQPLATERKIAIDESIDLTAAPMRGDEERLQQVVWNLLANAIKFSQPGSRIDVALASGPERHVLVVRDHGIGIDPTFLPQVFDRFRQADSHSPRRTGLGLGLAIVQHVVGAHGGTIAAHSEGRGHGATFTVSLPRPTALSSAA